MKWKQAFTSSVGRKLIMGLTGIFLILFLLVHCYINFQIFMVNGQEKFDAAAHFMGTNLIVHFLEVGLFVFFILHIVQGLMITAKNKAKRPVGYKVMPGNKNTKWYSRSMGLLGSLVLIFLVIHLSQFWAPNRYSQVTGGGELNLYAKMQTTFQHLWVVIVYIIGCIALAWHLVHGFWSAFHTLGISSMKYKPLIQGIGYAFSIIIPLAFISMPLSFYFGWLT